MLQQRRSKLENVVGQASGKGVQAEVAPEWAADATARPYDPTQTSQLRDLRAQAEARLQSLGVIGAAANPATALVLAGGGGKGAYQAGAILALYDCGLQHFSSVAGTSVGALNAALFKRLLLSRDRDIILGVWSDLRFSRVLKGSPWTIVKLLLYFPINLAAVHRPLAPDPDPFTALEFEKLQLVDLFSVIVRLYLTYAIPLMMGGLTLFAIIFGLDYLRGGAGSGDKLEKAIVLGSLALVPPLCRWLGRRISIADNGPLRKTVETVYDETLRSGDPEVICTLATVPPGMSASVQATYFSLADAKDKTAVIDLLIQSAALPEIFPMRKLHGNDHVDGGVEDNIPIMGLFPREPRRVFVVYLETRYKVAIQNNLNVLLRDSISALKLYESKRLDLIARRRGHKWEGPLREWFLKLELVPVIPSEDLGNLVTGTMNFFQSKARRLIALGYYDMLNALLSWQPREIRSSD